ncbi:hypothetical protein VTO42DRAFT_7983 [Malbranchea cinnamomea]
MVAKLFSDRPKNDLSHSDRPPFTTVTESENAPRLTIRAVRLRRELGMPDWHGWCSALWSEVACQYEVVLPCRTMMIDCSTDIAVVSSGSEQAPIQPCERLLPTPGTH